MVILNAPHNTVIRQNLRGNPRQLLRSWYMLFFQLPWLPEALGRAGNWRGMAWALRRTSRRGTFTDADLEHYRRAWSEPGAYTAMLNWYRALRLRPPTAARQGRITVPTLLLWGVHDAFLGREMAAQSVALCKQGELDLIQRASHWVQAEEPDRVNQKIVAFLGGG
jgi:pimeloyl-ACP methyl ester carboxylesterase